MLLQHGAKVNAQDLKNNSAAMVACFFNKPRILATLIRAGADIVPRNNEGNDILIVGLIDGFCLGKDAYDVAVEKEFDECKEIVAKALERRGIKAGVKPTPPSSGGDKLHEDVDKLRINKR